MSNSDDPDYVPDPEEDPQNVTNQVVTRRQSGTVNPQEPADEPADDSSDDDIPLIRLGPRQLGGGDGLEGPSSRIWRVDNDSDADFHAHRQSDSDADHDSDYSDHDSRPDCDSDSDCDSLPPGSGPATTAAAPPPGFAPIARDLSGFSPPPGWTPSTPPRQQRFSRREQTLRLSVSRVGPFVREWTVADDPPDASAATLKTYKGNLKRLLVRAGIITPETPIESLDLRELITLTPRRAAMRRTLAAELAKHYDTGYGMANALKWALKNVKRRLTAVEDDLEGEWASYIATVTALVDSEVQQAESTSKLRLPTTEWRSSLQLGSRITRKMYTPKSTLMLRLPTTEWRSSLQLGSRITRKMSASGHLTASTQPLDDYYH